MEIKNAIYTFDEVKEIYSKYITSKDSLDLIEKAYKFADKKHEGQFRKSGDPYVSHVLGVAQILSTLNAGPSTIVAGLLHDTIEDTSTTKEEIECCISFAKVKAQESADRYAAETIVRKQHETTLKMVDTMLANGKLTDEEISDISEIPLEEIKKRRALRERGL